LSPKGFFEVDSAASTTHNAWTFIQYPVLAQR
jgi:hypothetical protein